MSEREFTPQVKLTAVERKSLRYRAGRISAKKRIATNERKQRQASRRGRRVSLVSTSEATP